MPRRRRRKPFVLEDVLEELMSSIADLNSKVDTIQTTIAEVAAIVAGLKSQPPPVATQADLDALGTKLDTAQNALDAIRTS